MFGALSPCHGSHYTMPCKTPNERAGSVPEPRLVLARLDLCDGVSWDRFGPVFVTPVKGWRACPVSVGMARRPGWERRPG
jgi:hypothetical protein